MEKKRRFAPHFVKRCFVLVAGLVIMAAGVAMSIHANLGTSPISSLPYTLSVIIGPLTVGTATICMHVVLILLQILVLRKDYDPFQLVQLPVAIIFGYLTDFFNWLFSGITPSAYWQKAICCIIGIVLVALGVAIEVMSKVCCLAAEGFDLAVCQKITKLKFPTMKIMFDVFLVVVAAILGLVFTGQLQGVREGTIAAAIFVGLISKVFSKPLRLFEERFLM